MREQDNFPPFRHFSFSLHHKVLEHIKPPGDLQSNTFIFPQEGEQPRERKKGMIVTCTESISSIQEGGRKFLAPTPSDSSQRGEKHTRHDSKSRKTRPSGELGGGYTVIFFYSDKIFSANTGRNLNL